ncbi:MAG: hypothetical protein H6621_13270 [Halobacteriovoraceae bacterium]|nr:hypothetical protein [Halobacteriovoraceae bacterium]
MKGLLILIFVFSLKAQANEFLPQTFKVNIVQSNKSEITGKIRNTKSSLEYMYPGHIRFKEFKNNTEFISNNETSWLYTPSFIKSEKSEVRVGNAKNHIYGKIFDTLKPGLKTNKLYKVEKIKVGEYKLIFEPSTQKELNLKMIYLTADEQVVSRVILNSRASKAPNMQKKAPEGSQFTLGDIKTMKLIYTDDKEVVLTFDDFQQNLNYSRTHFVFDVPKNTKVVHQ